jgi:ParB-like chromosome segregation protein Spo0J
MALQVEYRAVADLLPYPRNSRTHSDQMIATLAGAIKEFGFTSPLLIEPDGGIIAGHARLAAARKLRMTEVPCIVLGHLSEAQKRALVIADNAIPLKSGWNEDLLKLELADLQGADFDVMTLGFDASELADLIGGKDVEPPSVFDGPGATRARSEPKDEPEADESAAAPLTSSAREIDPDAYEMACRCPRCGFEFDPPK